VSALGDALGSIGKAYGALIGGAIGAATGVITCTVISNLVKDSDSGLTTCDTKAYIAFGGGGFALGAVLGWLIR
jgi:hypothetical protein